MLLKHGYKPVLFVLESFKDDDKVPVGVEIRKVIPQFELIDYSATTELQEDFNEQVQVITRALAKYLNDINIAFTHDWIFQGWFLIYNAAMREAAKELKCRWLHWVHSAPSPRPANLVYPHSLRYTIMPNSKLIFMNNYDTLKLAEMYGGTLDDVRVVHNPLDPRSFLKLHPLVEKCIDKYDLLSADIVDVYPVSSTRFSGKQIDKVIKLMGKIKKHGKSVRLIFCNAHANADREKKAIKDMISYANKQGLTEKEVIFTSLEGKEYELGIPHEAVRDFFQLSNLFIFPTLSENCPLILLEAALSKCLLVLNEDFAPLRDFFQEDALYWKFGSLLSNTTYNDEEKWYSDVAMIIIGELKKNRPLNAFNKLKQRFNLDYIFKNQLQPVLHEKYDR